MNAVLSVLERAREAGMMPEFRKTAKSWALVGLLYALMMVVL